ncbi:AbrB/MazE/SpoVT family DNA-binding domain-containing protein [Bacillus cereus]|nr:AbrB/MazE/SpoVT family DNA-binding domain-containing protein [Bacillus cereus]MEB9613533.1 AbrB/MazE/SpoVT family DNA-binding domain-containing protein [Bacillus cereus]
MDELGRVVMPKELRDMLGIGIKLTLEIYVDSENVILGDGEITLSLNGAK